jgi:glycosyltransferase involved in cell wall biosynthesis
MKRMSLSVVVPVYNSEQSLPLLVDRLRPVFESMGVDHELILVNDGSHDKSWEVVTELARKNPWIRGINLMRNYGQHNALFCGIRAAKHEVIVTLDDDLQNPPEEIPKLLAKLDEGYDVVYGISQQDQHGVLRGVASKITKIMLQSAMGIDAARNVRAFRAFRTQIRDAFSHYNGPFITIDVVLTWGTTKFSAVEVKHDSRHVGASNYTLGKLVTHALNMVTSFSVKPLQYASIIGFSFTILGFVSLMYVVIKYMIIGGKVPGFAFLASIISIFSGVQLFVLGIFGEYLGRVFLRSLDRPICVIRESVGFVEPASTKEQETHVQR